VKTGGAEQVFVVHLRVALVPLVGKMLLWKGEGMNGACIQIQKEKIHGNNLIEVNA